MTRLPYMPLYVNDFVAATMLWDGPERALYLYLLSLQWTLGALPGDPEKLAKISAYDLATFRTLWKAVGKKFASTPEGLVNQRLEEHRERATLLHNSHSKKGKSGAKARWKNAPANAPANAPGNGTGIPQAMAAANGILKSSEIKSSEIKTPESEVGAPGAPPGETMSNINIASSEKPKGRDKAAREEKAATLMRATPGITTAKVATMFNLSPKNVQEIRRGMKP